MQVTRLRLASAWQARPFGYRSGQALPLQSKQKAATHFKRDG